MKRYKKTAQVPFSSCTLYERRFNFSLGASVPPTEGREFVSEGTLGEMLVFIEKQCIVIRNSKNIFLLYGILTGFFKGG